MDAGCLVSTKHELDTLLDAALERFMSHFEPLVSPTPATCYFLASTSSTMKVEMILNFVFLPWILGVSPSLIIMLMQPNYSNQHLWVFFEGGHCLPLVAGALLNGQLSFMGAHTELLDVNVSRINPNPLLPLFAFGKLLSRVCGRGWMVWSVKVSILPLITQFWLAH